MGWMEFAALAEILASLGVIGSLVLVALQLRHNTVIIQNSTYQNRAALLSEWARPLADNGELYSIYRRGLINDEQLSAEERGRFDLVLLQSFKGVEAVYQQMRSGQVPEDVWKQHMNHLAVAFRFPGGRRSWERQKEICIEGFVADVEAYFPKTPIAE